MSADVANEADNSTEKAITQDELRQLFPASKENSSFKYSGKCKYCQVEINFSETTQVRIIKNKGDSQKFSIYHVGCYDRYIRRTID